MTDAALDEQLHLACPGRLTEHEFDGLEVMAADARAVHADDLIAHQQLADISRRA